MADVTWDEGDRCVLNDQPMEIDVAIGGGPTVLEPQQFMKLWTMAQRIRRRGKANPMLAPSVVATFDELRIARGEEPGE